MMISRVVSWAAGPVALGTLKKSCPVLFLSPTLVRVPLSTSKPTPNFCRNFALKATEIPESSTHFTSLDDHDVTCEEQDMEVRPDLPRGTNGFFVTRTYATNARGFDMAAIEQLIGTEEIDRLELSSQNLTAPIALMVVDPQEYPTRSRARKACRNANIMIHRGPSDVDETTGKDVFQPDRLLRARVNDRVYPGDVIGVQVRMGDGNVPTTNHAKPDFELPVVYEDDHCAVCNKPAGVVVFAARGAGHGTSTVRAALPFSVAPPAEGTVSTLRRPQPVHRLDKPTSGLILVAKTKPSMIDLCRQFQERVVKKTYTAVVNGVPTETPNCTISSKEAYDLGVDVDPQDGSTKWQIMDHVLDDKPATTIWRILAQNEASESMDSATTMVELKPKTGRYHQLRRHMAWGYQCPIVGDGAYGDHSPFRGTTLMLCSNKVIFEHPYYNTRRGRAEFEKLREKGSRKDLFMGENGKVMVSASIHLPNVFSEFFMKLAMSTQESTF